MHGLRTPREEKAFTARPKIHSHSQIFRYGQSIFCLPLRPNFSDIFDLCLHWMSVVRDNMYVHVYSHLIKCNVKCRMCKHFWIVVKCFSFRKKYYSNNEQNCKYKYIGNQKNQDQNKQCLFLHLPSCILIDLKTSLFELQKKLLKVITLKLAINYL